MMRRPLLSLLLILLLLSLAAPSALALRYVVNSGDWTEVYSVMQLAAHEGVPAHFATSERHALIIHNDLPRGDDIFVINSRRQPYMAGFAGFLESKGFGSVIAEDYDNVNLAMADRSGLGRFIVVDPAYSYNALSVAAYALHDGAFVLFANQELLLEVEDFLEERDVESILIYGTVSGPVKDALEPYGPEIINENGDKFLNNIEVARRTLEHENIGQVILTNGDFMEQEIMSSRQAIVFVGRNSVPPPVAEFLQEANVGVGVLIGNELVRSALSIRRQTGISTIVKFGRDARVPSGGIGAVEALDMYYLPPLELSIEDRAIRYNTATNRIEIVIANTGDSPVYIKGSYTLRHDEGIQVVGDEQAVFLDAGEEKTITYALEERILDDEFLADLFILYGESPSSLEFLLERQETPVEIIDFADESRLLITEVFYSEREEGLLILVENPGGSLVYADAEVVDIALNDELETIGAEERIEVESESGGMLRIPFTLTEDDIANNEEVRVRLFYGEREDALVKVIEERYPLEIRSGASWLSYAPYAVALLLLLLILRKRKEKNGEKRR